MGKYDEAVAALVRGGVRNADDAASIVRSIGADNVLSAIKATGGAIDGNLLKQIKNLKIINPDIIVRIQLQNDIIYTNILKNAFKNGRIDDVIVNGKLVKGNFSVDDMVRVTGKSTDDITKMADDVDVKKAATNRKSDLIKLGISGSLVMGVVFLMLMTGKSNPVEAITETLKAAAETATDTGSSIFKKLFSSFRGAMGVSALCCFIICVIVIMWMVGSALLS